MSKENFTARMSTHENGNAASANVIENGNAFLTLVFGRYRTAIVVSLVATAIGAIAWIAMLTCGLLATTNMSNSYNWGLLIAIFAFLVGFGAGAQFLASILYLRDQTRFRNLACYAQAISLAGGVGAGAAIVADLGSPKKYVEYDFAP